MQHLPGMGPKTHHAGHQTRSPGRSTGDGGNHPAVPLVQAIKTAQGNGRGPLGVLG